MNDPRGRWSQIINFLNTIAPDIIILLEAWNWDDGDLREFGEQTGLSYYFLNRSNTQHHLALLSRVQPTKIESIREGFHHSVLRARFECIGEPPLELFGLHLNPVDEDSRLLEAREILGLTADRDALLVGDFNSLATADEYNETNLLNLLREQGIKKFGTDKLQKKVIEEFLKAGYIDIIKKFHPYGLEYSVPTAVCTDVNHATRLRLDYALATPAMAALVKNASIIRNELTDAASDHFPLLLDIHF